MRIRVLIADGLASASRDMSRTLSLASDIEVVGEAADGFAAVSMSARALPDVVLLDLDIPRLDSMATIRAIRHVRPQTRIILLAASDSVDKAFEGVKAGARACLAKNSGVEQLLDAVRGLHRGESRLSPRVARKVLDQFLQLAVAAAPREPDVPLSRDDDARSLTDKEENILRLIIVGRSNHAIAETLSLSEDSVNLHLSRIVEKLHAAHGRLFRA